MLKGKKGKLLTILSAVLLSILAAVLVSLCFSGKSAQSTDYSFDLSETGGAAGFLSQFFLDYDSQESSREIIFPHKSDEVLVQYNELQSSIGLNVLKFSGKRVEERYLRLKNKTKSGQMLYSVLYIYKDKIIACHITTLLDGSELLPITSFV